MKHVNELIDDMLADKELYPDLDATGTEIEEENPQPVSVEPEPAAAWMPPGAKYMETTTPAEVPKVGTPAVVPDDYVPPGAKYAETIAPPKAVEAPASDEPSVIVDVLKQVGAGVPRAAAALLGMIGDVQNLTDVGREKIADLLGVPEELRAKKEDYITFPGAEDIKEFASDITGVTLPKAETRAGKIAGAATEFATEAAATVLTGGAAGVARLGVKAAAKGVKEKVLKKAKEKALEKIKKTTAKTAAVAAVSGVTSETAGQLAEGTGFETAARIAGGLLGGPAAQTAKVGLASAVQNIKSVGKGRGREVLHELTKGVTSTQFKNAQKLMDDAAEIGITLRADEALGLQKLKSAGYEIGHHDVMKKVADYRAGKVESIIKKDAATVGKEGTPLDVAGKTKEASDAFIENKKTLMKRKFVGKHFDAAKGQTAPVYVAQNFVSELKNLSGTFKNSKKFKKMKSIASEISELVTKKGVKGKVPRYETDVHRLNELYKKLRKEFDTSGKSGEPTKAARDFGGEMSPLIKKFGDEIADISPDIATGRAVHAKVQKEILEPLKKSMVGKLGEGSKSFSAMSKTLLDPMNARPGQIKGALRRLATIDKELPGKFARVHIENALDNALGTATPGKTLIANVIGSPQQAKNLKAMMDAADTARGIPTGTGFRTLRRTLKVFENMSETIRIDPSISPAARRDTVASMIIGLANFGRGGAAGMLQRGMATRRQEKTFAHIADVLTSKKGLKELEKLSKIDISSPDMMRNAFIGAMIATQQEAEK